MWQIIPKGTVDRMVRLLLVGLSVCFLSACEQKTEIIIPQPGERTVLIYFAADNDLAPFALEDIDELKEGVIVYGLPSDEHLLMYVDIGGTASLSELTYQNGKAVEKVIKTYPTRNSAGLAETQEVFQDVFNNPAYEAASYGLVYWSHCDGWIPYPVPTTRWIGIDTGGYADNCMNLSEFKEVLQTSAPHFDFILFDACFMQSIEVAYELRNFTDYYICSPTETPGPGAPYDAILPYMFQPGASPELAEAYFDVYNGMYNQGGSEWSYGVSMCALKTSELVACCGHSAGIAVACRFGRLCNVAGPVVRLRPTFSYLPYRLLRLCSVDGSSVGQFSLCHVEKCVRCRCGLLGHHRL